MLGSSAVTVAFVFVDAFADFSFGDFDAAFVADEEAVFV
jgi:hypothetical protein